MPIEMKDPNTGASIFVPTEEEKQSLNKQKQVYDNANKVEVMKDIRVFLTSYKHLCPVDSSGTVTDWTPALNQSVLDSDNQVIQFPKGDVPFKTEPDVIQKYVRLEGYGSKLTHVRLNGDINGFTFRGKNPSGAAADSYLGDSSVGISEMTISGKDIESKKAVSFIYVGRARMYDVVISHYGGNALYFRSAQDMTIDYCDFRYCGSQSKGLSAVFMDTYNTGEGAVGLNNVNEIKFITCKFEHNKGVLFESTGKDNNSNKFIGCKFEYMGISTDSTPIKIKDASRFDFNGCTFTHYDYTGMFDIDNSWSIRIDGIAFNNIEPRFFAKVNNSTDIVTKIQGRKPGKNILQGNTYNVEATFNEQEYAVATKPVLTTYNPIHPIDLRNIMYPDHGAKIVDDLTGTNGVSIQSDDKDWKRVLLFPINNSQISRDGVTFWLKLKSSSVKTYEFRLKGETFEDVLRSPSIGTNADWYHFTVPAYKLNEKCSLVVNSTAGQVGVTLSVLQIYYENKYFTSSIPTVGYFTQGDYVTNLTRTIQGSTGTKYIIKGWIRVSTGNTHAIYTDWIEDKLYTGN